MFPPFRSRARRRNSACLVGVLSLPPLVASFPFLSLSVLVCEAGKQTKQTKQTPPFLFRLFVCCAVLFCAVLCALVDTVHSLALGRARHTLALNSGCNSCGAAKEGKKAHQNSLFQPFPLARPSLVQIPRLLFLPPPTSPPLFTSLGSERGHSKKGRQVRGLNPPQPRFWHTWARQHEH